MTPLEAAAQVESTMKAATKALDSGLREVTKPVGKVARAEMRRTATIVPGSDRRFSNFPRAGSLRVKIRPDRGGMGTWVIPVGPWGIAEKGAGPHPVNHPGTRGKQGRRSWTIGMNATFAELGQEVPEGLAKRVEAAFDGG